MDFTNLRILLIAFLASNTVALVILVAAYKAPKLARLLFLLLFGWASWINYTTSHNNPIFYLDYATHSVKIYADFINGWFKDHITVMVTLIAIGQLMIAIGMLLNGWWVRVACIGAIIFLMAIAPLGIYAAFPFSLIASLAAYFIVRNDNLDYLWHFKRKS